jgi:hypothetical protein
MQLRDIQSTTSTVVAKLDQQYLQCDIAFRKIAAKVRKYIEKHASIIFFAFNTSLTLALSPYLCVGGAISVLYFHWSTGGFYHKPTYYDKTISWMKHKILCRPKRIITPFNACLSAIGSTSTIVFIPYAVIASILGRLIPIFGGIALGNTLKNYYYSRIE